MASGKGEAVRTAPGREAAIAALVAAATELFAERGPDGTSLRAVAAAAGLNYGLIHQYVGSKDDLLRLVVRSVSEHSARDFETSPELDAVVDRLVRRSRTPYVTMLAWALLQGHDARELLGRSPALATLAERVGELPERDGRIAAVVSMALGWQLFGDFVSAGLGYDAQPPADLTAAVRSLALELLGDG